MTRLLSLIISFLVGRAIKPDPNNSAGLIKLPMLMLRKITQLWLMGLGILLIGVVGVALLLLEVSQQLQLQQYVAFTSSMMVSLVVIAISVISCGLVLRRSVWANNEDVNPPLRKQESAPSELVTVLALLAKDFLDDRIRSRELADAQASRVAEASGAMNVAELKNHSVMSRATAASVGGGHIS